VPFLLSDDAPDARISEFDQWREQQKKAAEDAANAAAAQVSATANQAGQALSGAGQQINANVAQFDQWADQQRQAAAAKLAAQTQADQAQPQVTVQPSAPVSPVSTQPATPDTQPPPDTGPASPDTGPAPAPDLSQPAPAPVNQDALDQFDQFVNQQRSGVGQAIGGVASNLGTLASQATTGSGQALGGLIDQKARELDQAVHAVTSEPASQPGGPSDVLGVDQRNTDAVMGTSQLPENNPQLTAAEAYAACGPAAAVRFAQFYGRNPTLREAVDLATSVGWTSANGMAGIGSEKALMDKLGISTHMVGANWDAIAREATTGNPVTISTPGHYFMADGFNPDTGAFHVGRSGLDLRGGSEWMTPAQMEARMGKLQGALFADNPNVPSTGGQGPVSSAVNQATSHGSQSDQGGWSPPDPTKMLDKNGVIAYVQKRAKDFGLDPAAVLAVANQEGLNTDPGSHWKLPGEGNISFGPASWYGNGAGADIIKQQGDNAPAWSWTPPGLDYWLNQVSSVASGLTGNDAVTAIVNKFERPREDLAAGEIARAQQVYSQFQQAVGDAASNLGSTASNAVSSAGDALSSAGSQALSGVTGASTAIANRADELKTSGATALLQAQNQLRASQDQLNQETQDAAKRNQTWRDQVAAETEKTRQDLLNPRNFSFLDTTRQALSDAGSSDTGQAIQRTLDIAPSPAGGTIGDNLRDIQSAPDNLQTLGQSLRDANDAANQQSQQQSPYALGVNAVEGATGRQLPDDIREGILNAPAPPGAQAPDLSGPLSAFLKTSRILPANQTVNLPFLGPTPLADIVGQAANFLVPVGAEERFAGGAAGAGGRAAGRAAVPTNQLRVAAAVGDKLASQRLAISAAGRWARSSVEDIMSDLAKGPVGDFLTDTAGTLDVDKLREVAAAVKDQMTRVVDRVDVNGPSITDETASSGASDVGNVTTRAASANPIADFLTGEGSEVGSVSPRVGARLGGAAAGVASQEATMSDQDKADPWGRFGRDVAAGVLSSTAPGVAVGVARRGLYNDVRGLRVVQPSLLTAAGGRGTPAELTSAVTKDFLLSGPKTHLTNILTQLAELGRQPLATALSGREDDAVTGLKTAASAVPDAFSNFVKTMQSGSSAYQPTGHANTPVYTPFLRLLGATDDFFRTIGWAMGAGQEGSRALREGASTGLSPSAILSRNQAAIDKAGQTAGSLSVFGEGGSPGAHAITSLKNSLLGAKGDYGKQALGMMLDAGVPFAAIPGRIWNIGLKRIPGVGELDAMARAGIAFKKGDVNAARQALGDGLTQSVATAAILSNVANGNIRGPDDPEHPSGVKIAGQWYDYSGWGAWALPMAIPAAIYESAQKEGNKPNPNQINAAINAMGKAMGNQFYLADLVKTLNQVGEGNASGAIGQLAGSYADRYLPYSGALNQATAAWDPILRDTTRDNPLLTVVARQQAKIPGLEAQLPAQPVMTSGQPQERRSAGFGELVGMQTRPASALETQIADLERKGYKIPDPTKAPTSVTISGSVIPLTDDEQRQVATERGKLIDQAVQAQINTPTWEQMTDTQKARTLASIMSRFDDRSAALWTRMVTPEERARRVAAGKTVVGKLQPVGSR
jgi:hypothetical protein